MDYSFLGNNPVQDGDVPSQPPPQQPPQQAQPALSLFHQNSRLNNGIDEARKAYNKGLEEIEDTKERTEHLIQVERVTMEEQSKAAIQERESLLEELENTQVEKFVAVQEEEFNAKALLDQANDRAKVAEDTIKAQRKAFLEACAEYRHKIQLLSFQGEALGMATLLAPLQACAALQGHSGVGDTNQDVDEEWCKNLDQLVASLSDAAGLVSGSLEQGDDHDDEDDEELQEALQALQKRKDNMKATQNVLQELRAEKEEAEKNEDKREVQKMNLLTQRERLEKDVADLRTQIEETELQVAETEAMLKYYKDDEETKRRQRQQGTSRNGETSGARMASSRPVTNPYQNQRRREAPKDSEVDDNGSPKSSSGRTITPQSNGHNKKQTRSSKSSRRKQGRQGSTPAVETTQPPASTQQFPHRSGRVRKSNKFGASLRKSSMDVTDSMAQIVMGVSAKQMARRTLGNSDSSEDEGEFSDHSSRPVSKRTKFNDKTSHNNKNGDDQPSSSRKRSPAIEDDTDDDDSVLHFNPFAK